MTTFTAVEAFRTHVDKLPLNDQNQVVIMGEFNQAIVDVRVPVDAMDRIELDMLQHVRTKFKGVEILSDGLFNAEGTEPVPRF
ncbi:MAG: hypothetical protein ACRBDI_03200 [Alphaproteobacteria bacterium]